MKKTLEKISYYRGELRGVTFGNVSIS